MNDNTINIPVEILEDPIDQVEIQITDPTDGTVHTFTGPDEVSVNRQIDQFWGIDNANQDSRP